MSNSSDMLERVPPHSVEAEMGVLGSMLINPDVFDDVQGGLRSSSDFYVFAHQVLFRHIAAIHNEGTRLDTTLLLDRLRKAGDLDSIGGVEYLIEVANSVPSAANAVYYAEIVRGHAQRRAMIQASAEILRGAYDQQTPLDDLHAKADQLVNGIDITTRDEPLTAEAAVMQAVEALDRRARGDEPPALTTGLSDLDRTLGGLRSGELAIIAARPSMGKTALALGIADHAASNGKPTLFVSLEMSARELVERTISARSGVDGSHIRDGKLLDCERHDYDTSAAKVAQLPLWTDAPTTITAYDIVAKAQRLRRKHGLNLLVVDYLGLVSPENPKDPRHEQVSKITRRMKQLARELQIPVVLLAQLNRETEKGGDHRPRLGHLRESGSIEQDADAVLFVHREEYYRPLDPDVRGKAEIIIAKNRSGATGCVEVNWQSQFTKFVNAYRYKDFG